MDGVTDRSVPDAAAGDGAGSGDASHQADRSPAKKSVWKQPANGSPQAATAVAAAVMGADLWPALSESAKPSAKPSSGGFDSPKFAAVDPAAAVAPGIEISSLGKPNPNNQTFKSNSVQHAHQKSVKRGGNGSSPAGGSVMQQQIVSENVHSSEQSLHELAEKNNNSWEHGGRVGKVSQQPYAGAGGGSSQRGHNSNRRGNNGGGGGGGRRNQGRGGGDGGGFYRGPGGGRDIHGMQPIGAPQFIRQPPPPLGVAPPPYLGPHPPMPPFMTPFVYHDVAGPVSPVYIFTPPPPPESMRGISFAPPPAGFFVPQFDPRRAALLKQIEYYFSTDNLCKDMYLRENMDEQGWVPVSLIANFNKVKELTNNLQYIMETIRLSTVLEVQMANVEKIRRRNDWMAWVLPRNNNLPNASSSPHSPIKPDVPNMSAQFHKMGLEGIPNPMAMTAIAGQPRGTAIVTQPTQGVGEFLGGI